MMRVVLLSLFVASTTANLLQTTAKCGPNTKLFISDAEDAAGAPQFTQVTGVVDGVCIDKPVTTITHVKFCGPGKLTISRMSCKKHDYKLHTYEHSKSEYTTQCETIAAAGTMVEGYFG